MSRSATALYQGKRKIKIALYRDVRMITSLPYKAMISSILFQDYDKTNKVIYKGGHNI